MRLNERVVERGYVRERKRGQLSERRVRDLLDRVI